MSSRRGFTLIELLVALILLVLVGGGIYQTLLVVQRVSLRQTEVSATAGAVRSGVQLIQSELQEITNNATLDESDIVSMTASAIRYHAMRGIGEACEITTTYVKVREGSYQGLRFPTADRDQILLFFDGDSLKSTDDHWHSVGFSGPTASTCSDGTVARILSFSTALTPTQRDSVWIPSPIRTSEQMEIGIVNDNGKDWLGIRSVSSGTEPTLLPVVGPISALAFQYVDKTNTVTATLSAVSTVKIVLTGITDRAVTTGVGSAVGNPTETLRIIVQLRNSK